MPYRYSDNSMCQLKIPNSLEYKPSSRETSGTIIGVDSTGGINATYADGDSRDSYLNAISVARIVADGVWKILSEARIVHRLCSGSDYALKLGKMLADTI